MFSALLFPTSYFFVPIFGTIVVCIASFYFVKCIQNRAKQVPLKDPKIHSWKSIKLSSRPWYCSICESLLLHGIGVYCDCCGVCADPECIKQANSTLSCKVIASKSEEFNHHWVRGNLPLGANCVVCQEECSQVLGLIDYQCCWCQRYVHEGCMPDLSVICDLGQYMSMIVPPWCVQTIRLKGSINRHLLLRGVIEPEFPDWSPLIVVANCKSGNSEGDDILSAFRRVLNPAQVIDLAERSPAAALQWAVRIAPKQIRLLVAGGDGTASWLLTTSHKMDLEPQPAIAILPLGTGNDLSRVLGWGKETPAKLGAPEIIDRLFTAHLSEIDRWKVEVNPARHLGILMPSKTYYMYNYFSIGVDARVALDFHQTRSSKFYLFSSRLLNKILYLIYGTNQVMRSNCKNIEQHLDLFLDGKKVALPCLESIVVLNIPSWGAGVDLWSMSGEWAPQSYRDGILEVVGIYSSFHIAQLQVGLSSPHYIGQAKRIEFQLHASAPVQIDGEPWDQLPASIVISLVDKAPVLINKIKGVSVATSPTKFTR